ncbi:hypothetical protein HAX54_041258 [Datura stramonium]|uniref:Uncharacterized protein n=1 Tax=Datura stramonium TaxID=4076 RepID=A0ABS8VPB2_DATST|nr:hypothetical protein [Datura stramonium]
MGNYRNASAHHPVSRSQEYSPPGRNRNRDLPPARTRNWEHSPRGWSRERHLSPSGQMIGEQRASTFTSRRDYGLSQSLRIPDRDRGNADILDDHSRRLHEIKEGLGNEDSTSTKYPWSHLLDKPRKFDTIKGSGDYELMVVRVSRERENRGRPYPGFVDGSKSSEADKLYSSYESHLPDVGVQPRISSVGNSGGYSLPSRYLDADRLKDEEIHLQDGFHSHKTAGGGPTSTDPYMEDSLKSHDIQSSILITQYRHLTLTCCPWAGYDKIPGTMSSLNPEESKGEVGSPNALSGEFYGKRVGSGEAHFQDVPRSNMGLGKYDEFSHRNFNGR